MSREGSVAPKARIDLRYRLPYGDPNESFELPLKILVMGDFTLRLDDRPIEERRLVEVDRDSFDRVLAEQNIELDVVVADARSRDPDAERSVRLVFKGMADFTPEGIVGQVPDLLPAQVHEVLHDAQFQELERAWRSLEYLVDRVDSRENIKVEVLHCSKEDLALDFDDSPGVTRSGLYKRVYLPAFQTFGGQPYGLIVGDYTFDASPQDISLLQQIASVAAMAHAPFVAAAAPSMFGFESWEELPRIHDLKGFIFDAPRYGSWQRLREHEDSRYVALTLPRFLLRLPYGADATPVKGFAFEEDVIGHHERYLWGNAAFAFATRVADSFAKYRWCPNIIGPEAGGAVEDIPLHQYEAMGEIQTKIPTECQLSERREYELSEEGFIGLAFSQRVNYPCFFSASSVQKAKYYGQSPEGRAAEANYRLGTQLPYLFMLTRFAHYLKVMTWQHDGIWMERNDIEHGLNAWLSQHSADMDNPAPGVRGPCVFRRAVVTVEDVEGQPGWYRFNLRVRPNFKHMGMAFELSLVGKIDKG